MKNKSAAIACAPARAKKAEAGKEDWMDVLENQGPEAFRRLVVARQREAIKHMNREAWRNRPKCGGKRRSDGKACEAKVVPGRKRCRWHEGASTGPRTEEGKARCAENLKKAPSRALGPRQAGT